MWDILIILISYKIHNKSIYPLLHITCDSSCCLLQPTINPNKLAYKYRCFHLTISDLSCLQLARRKCYILLVTYVGIHGLSDMYTQLSGLWPSGIHIRADHLCLCYNYYLSPIHYYEHGREFQVIRLFEGSLSPITMQENFTDNQQVKIPY